MKLNIFSIGIARLLGKLLSRTDSDLLTALLALPDVERSPPITISRYRPILDVLQPVAEASGTDGLRDPVDGFIVSDKIVLDLGHLDIPGLSRIVDKRCITTPAERIIMLELRRREQQLFLGKILDHHRISVLDKCSDIRSLLSHKSLVIDELYKRQIIVSADLGIVLTKCRSDMNYTCTVCHGYIAVTGDEVSLFMLLLAGRLYKIKERLVLLSLKVCSLEALQNLISLAVRCSIVFFQKIIEHCIEQCLCHIVGVTVDSLYLAVGLVRVHAESDVARQCPRGRRPCQEVSILADDFETDYR